jgi:hypothetical protein
MSNQRPGKTHKAALGDSEKIRYTDLVEFCKKARLDLENEGDSDAALRFEILEDWLRSDFKGQFKYSPKMIGL